MEYVLAAVGVIVVSWLVATLAILLDLRRILRRRK